MNIESIYQSKLNQFKSVMEANSAKCSGAELAFKDLLDAVEQRLNGINSGYQSSAANTAGINTVSAPSTIKTSSSTAEIEAVIENVAASTGLDPNLIRAVIQTESSYRTDAVSRCGAQGLMQLMPGTARELGVTDSFDAYQNVKGGSTYLKKQIDRFGDVRLALAAYNTGPARIARLGITNPDNTEEYEKISSGVRGYVAKVMKYYDHYSRTSA